MLKKTVFAMAFVSLLAVSASAQSYDITDADSNFTDTTLTVEFSGLPADEQLTLESLGSDITEQATFTTTGSGSATVSWRHNPFPDGTALINDGWTYRLRNTDGSFNYEFEIQHGNMLLALDTFDDGSVNKDVVNAESGTSVSEQNSLIKFDPESGGRLYFEENFDEEEVFIIDTGYFQGNGGYDIQLKMESGTEDIAIGFSNTAESDLENTIYKVWYDTDSQEWVFESDGTELYRIQDSRTKVDRLAIYSGGTGASSEYLEVESYSIAPQISEENWKTPRKYDVGTNAGFNNYLVNYNGTLSLEFSNDGSSWSQNLPASSNTLYYRNTASATIGAVAVDTTNVFEELTFNPIRPDNNTAFVVEDGNSLNRDFLYEILYERTDCSDFAGLFSSFQLFNTTSGNRLDSTTYPNLELSSGQCVFFKEFTEEKNLPAGDYRWRVAFRDNEIDVEQIWNQYFSIEEASDVPVSFELRQPSESETVYLDNGSTEFKYSVDANSEGTLSLKIPQYNQSTRYQTTIASGNQTGSVVLDLDYGVNYDWYLTWTNSTTYQSDTISFNTADEGDSPDDGTDGSDGTDGTDGSTDGTLIDVSNLWYSLWDLLGLGSQGASFIAGIFVTFAVAYGAFFLAGTTGGIVGLNLGMILSGVIGLFPTWIVMVPILIGAYAIASWGESAVNG